jgi:hypothetical protein
MSALAIRIETQVGRPLTSEEIFAIARVAQTSWFDVCDAPRSERDKM